MNSRSRLRVAIVNQFAIPPTEAGGTRHHSLARALLARGHEVVIIAGSRNYATAVERIGDGKAVRSQEVEGVRYIWLRTPRFSGGLASRARGMVAFARRVAFLRDPFEGAGTHVVIGSSPPPFAAWAAGRLAGRLDARFVLEVRDLWPETLVHLGRFSRRNPLIRLMFRLERHLYRSASR